MTHVLKVFLSGPIQIDTLQAGVADCPRAGFLLEKEARYATQGRHLFDVGRSWFGIFVSMP